MENKIYAMKIKVLRESRNWTQKDLSIRTGIHEKTISSYETGRNEPPYENMKILAETFGVSVDYLVDSKNSNPPYIDARELTIEQIYALGIVADQFRQTNKKIPKDDQNDQEPKRPDQQKED